MRLGVGRVRSGVPPCGVGVLSNSCNTAWCRGGRRVSRRAPRTEFGFISEAQNDRFITRMVVCGDEQRLQLVCVCVCEDGIR